MTIHETYHCVGSVDQFVTQIGRVVEIDGKQIAIFRTSDNGIFALENRNPNPKGGTLVEGIVSGQILYDPLYDWRIDLKTGLVQAPDQGQVATFAIKIEDGQVYLGKQL